MDGPDSYGKAKAVGQDQSLGSVPEEEESDWSEVGEERPWFIMTRSYRSHPAGTAEYSPWQQGLRCWAGPGEGNVESESGGEETVQQQHSLPRSLQVPHLQFTVHPDVVSLPIPVTDSDYESPSNSSLLNSYRVPTSWQMGSSPIRVRSASLEELPLGHHRDAMMDVHHHSEEDRALEDSDNEIIHHWRMRNNMDTAAGRQTDSGPSEMDGSLTSLQSSQKMLSHFICQLHPREADGQDRVEVQGWMTGVPDEVLKGERTQL